MPSQEEALLKSKDSEEEEEREYEEQLNDEDEEQSIDINASPKQSMDTPSPRDPRFSPRSQASTLPRLEAMQRPSPPTEEEDTWQYDPIDPNKISPMKLKEFNAKVKSLPFYVTFEEAWDKHGLVEFFFTTSENKEEIHQLFRKARFPLAPHAVNQPPSPPSHHTQVPACPSKQLGATTHSPPFFHNCKETPEDIRELFEKAKVQPTFKTLYKIEDPGQFSIPCQVNGHYFDRTLCDSGSCINLMPTQTAKLLGITRLQPAQISIGLANHTIAKPRGVVIDVLLEIGDIKIPVDFHVINIQGGCDTPLILGRPFLATAGAVMDLPNRRMSLPMLTRQSFTRPYHSSHQTSCLTSSLPKAAQESHQTTLKESKNHTMVKKIYHKKNVHSWRDLMAEQNLSTLAHVFWSILEHMGHEEHGGTWHMEAAQLDTQRKKGEAILKTSSTVYSTNRSSSSTRPAKLQLDRAEKSKSNPKNVASPLTFL
ncbi:unnamed protein product [Microthlaspi erraticum]|uniref:Aspartic peptidase DDI1-type domain-containing protein n=1 Tax=Microthlaspi erraticum TaxID=1685480 RepID=A0A6D2HLG5_9BRAS|nr:unnamed protein product [Microthlaspi erraticum]